MTDGDIWNEVCEDADCDDTNFHATVDELLERIRKTSEAFDVVNAAEDIVLQYGITNDDTNE